MKPVLICFAGLIFSVAGIWALVPAGPFRLAGAVSAAAFFAGSAGILLYLQHKKRHLLALLQSGAALEMEGEGHFEGRITDEAGFVSPFSQRRVAGYEASIVMRTRQRDTRRAECVFRMAEGALTLKDAKGSAAFVRLDEVRFTPEHELLTYPVKGHTCFRTSRSNLVSSQMPAHLLAFLAKHELPLPTKDELFKPGVELCFNERLFLPNQEVHVAGTYGRVEGDAVDFHAVEGRAPLFGPGPFHKMRRDLWRGLWGTALMSGLACAAAGFVFPLIFTLGS